MNSELVLIIGFRFVVYSVGLQKLQEMRKSLVQKSMVSYDLDDDYEVILFFFLKQLSLESIFIVKEFRTKTFFLCILKVESLDVYDDQVDLVFSVEEGEKFALFKVLGLRSYVLFSDLKIFEVSMKNIINCNFNLKIKFVKVKVIEGYL